jgi:hypothetical protein
VAEPTAELTTTPSPSESAGEPVANPTAPAATAPPPEPQIDPLFLIYICNQRNDPAYSAALEQWGYLTHGGKELLCLEYHHGNLAFVLHHQGLIHDEARDELNRFLQGGDAQAFVHQHEYQTTIWFDRVLAAGEIRPQSEFGSSVKNIHSYESIDVLYQSYVDDSDLATSMGLAQFIIEWTKWYRGQPSAYSASQTSLGDQLHRTLTGSTESHLSRRLLISGQTEDQFTLIRSLVVPQLAGTTSHGARNAIASTLDRQWYDYQSAIAAQPSLRFDEFLLLNSERFLDHYWSGRDWTPRSNYR